MKKKILSIGLLLIACFFMTGCGSEKLEETDAIRFKNDYESLNGTTNDSSREYRSVSIREDNPFVFITGEELIEKLDNNETFYVYFGSPTCPWCRSVIETFTEVAKENGVSTIYYLDIWDDEGNEIFRDRYIINDNNELEKTVEGTDEYYEILSRFSNLLDDYTLTDNEGNEVSTGEKRLFAPTFVSVEDGKASKLVTGIPSSLTNSYGELTEEMLEEERDTFSDFFKNLCVDELC